MMQCIAIVLPFFIYLLSLGPAMKVISDQPSLRPLLSIYQPLFFLARQAEWIGAAFDWYTCDLWQVPPRERRWTTK